MKVLRIALWVLFVVVGFCVTGHCTNYTMGSSHDLTPDDGRLSLDQLTGRQYYCYELASGTGTTDSLFIWASQGSMTGISMTAMVLDATGHFVDSATVTSIPSGGTPTQIKVVLTGQTITSGNYYYLGIYFTGASGSDVKIGGRDSLGGCSGLATSKTNPLTVDCSGAEWAPNLKAILYYHSSGGSAPGVPTLVSPSNAATGQATSPTLSWSAGTGSPTSYTLQVSTSATLVGGAGTAFATTVYSQSGLTSTSQSVSLSASTTYYWHVLATNGNGSSAYTTPWSFGTGAASVGNRVMFKH